MRGQPCQAQKTTVPTPVSIPGAPATGVPLFQKEPSAGHSVEKGHFQAKRGCPDWGKNHLPSAGLGINTLFRTTEGPCSPPGRIGLVAR